MAALLVVLFVAGIIPGLKHDKKSQPAAAAVATQPTTPPKGTPTPNPIWAKITPEDLLAAVFTRSEVEQLVNVSGGWPRSSEFRGPPPPEPDLKGVRFWVSQRFDRVNGPEQFYIALELFSDAATASDCFASLLGTTDKGGTVISGPAIADEQRYFTRTNVGS